MSHSHCLAVREGDMEAVRSGLKAGGNNGKVNSWVRGHCDQSWSERFKNAKRQLTLYRTEAPTLVLAVVVGSSTPEVTVLAPDISAVVEPLAIIQEGQIAGATMRVPLDCVYLWGAKRGETSNPCMMQERRAMFVLSKIMAVNCAELKYLVCFLSDLHNQADGQNRGWCYSQHS